MQLWQTTQRKFVYFPLNFYIPTFLSKNQEWPKYCPMKKSTIPYATDTLNLVSWESRMQEDTFDATKVKRYFVQFF